MNKKWTALLTGLLLLFICVLQPMGVAYAASTKTGTVTTALLYVRAGDGTDNKVVGEVYKGDIVTILDQNKDGSWYKIQKGSLTGWSSATYITINDPVPEAKPNVSFEEQMKAFPADYQSALREIHEEFPSWNFIAEPLTMTWATALSKESKVRLNTIYTSTESWKSMEKGAYDWSTKQYVNVDSGYVTADPLVVAYYLDPRNFLDSTYIFQFEDLNFSDEHTVEGIKAILPSALDKHAANLLKAAKVAKVNAYFLATRMTQEGSHINKLGLGTYPGYEGYYNFFNIGAYPHSGNSAVKNGAIYAKNKGWNTPYKALLGGAEFLGKGYINLGQDTLYYQKFNMTNTTSGLYTHQYMTNVQAPSSEGAIRRRSITQAELNSSLTFVIPVYKNMPAKVAAKPSTTGNNNNFLDSITVADQTLTPTFERYTTAYSLQVGSQVDTVTIQATKNNPSATLSGGGVINLDYGINTIKLKVKATSGKTRTYTLTITREGSAPPDPNAPTITGPFEIVEALAGVEPGTPVKDFLQALAIKNGTAALFTADDKPKTSGQVANGDVLKLYNSDTSLYKLYPVLIVGDVNGDSRITSQDLRRTQRHILKMETISGTALSAADANKDSTINSQDLRRIQRHILGLLDSLQ